MKVIFDSLDIIPKKLKKDQHNQLIDYVYNN